MEIQKRNGINWNTIEETGIIRIFLKNETEFELREVDGVLEITKTYNNKTTTLNIIPESINSIMIK